MKGYTDYRVTIWENLISAMSSCQMNLGIVGGKIYIEGPEAGGGGIPFSQCSLLQNPIAITKYFEIPVAIFKKIFPIPSGTYLKKSWLRSYVCNS